MPYIKREAEKTIRQVSETFKVLVLTGARQVGKSTLLQNCAPDRAYVTLDDPKARMLAVSEPELFMEKFRPPVTIDEIQYAPNLLPYIKMEVDKSDINGQYWLTGSQHFNVMEGVSESLAGRAAILNLRGLSLREMLGIAGRKPFLPSVAFAAHSETGDMTMQDLFSLIWKGSYPAININGKINKNRFYGSYVSTYIERDIRQIVSVADENGFMHFLKVIAGRTGQMLNYADVANDAGESVHTVKKWLSLLLSTDIVFLLEPYYSSRLKRAVKTPKLYFSDTGLCSYLADWNSSESLATGAMAGAYLETFVVNEIVKSYKNAGETAPIYYYRDKDKKEIDVIIEKDDRLYPVEIKKTSSPNRSMTDNFKVIDNDRRGYGALISLVKESWPVSRDVSAVPIWDI